MVCLLSSSEVIHLFSPSDESTTNPASPVFVVLAEWFLEPLRSPGSVISFGSAGWKDFSHGGSCSPSFCFQALVWGTRIVTTLRHQKYLLKCFSLVWLTWFNQLCVWFMQSHVTVCLKAWRWRQVTVWLEGFHVSSISVEDFTLSLFAARNLCWNLNQNLLRIHKM